MRPVDMILSMAAAPALLVAGCSGGDEPVVVSGPGPAAGERPQPPSGSPANPFPLPSSSGGSCATCYDVVAGGATENLCPGVMDTLEALASCACGPCSTDCWLVCNSAGELDSGCTQCLALECQAAWTECQYY